ncbi:hypothetical protein JQS43_00490 [Natronosporangium hydrolyticum]|uniref:Uncharacterized protein n=1 Tax=Natronosporangium hydrolyticum TaxID=2811111 RepID=A0A895YHC5_9ACTN|nr:hypothetical protein [Natronosporangium hydrolyticum]QSB14909.1 hypothetical protein JQS43_00490 [Natronosporangium hydrolyticum]
MLVLAVAVAAAVTLLVLGRPGDDDEPGPGAETGPAAPGAPGAGWPPAEHADPPPPPPAAAPTTPARGATAAPTAPVPTVLPHDESGVTGDESLPAEAAAAAVAAAEQFAQRWVEPHPDWHDRVAELATPALAAALAAADPPQPPPSLTGPGQLLFDTQQWARVGVPADRGTLVLDLVVVDDQWRATAVDWWPA